MPRHTANCHDWGIIEGDMLVPIGTWNEGELMALLRRVGRLATKTGRFWTDAYVLYLAARDNRVPLYARLAAGAFAVYVLSPIDIVPDPIPLIGIVDDFIIIPLGLT